MTAILNAASSSFKVRAFPAKKICFFHYLPSQNVCHAIYASLSYRGKRESRPKKHPSISMCWITLCFTSHSTSVKPYCLFTELVCLFFQMLLPSFAQVISYAINKCSFQLQDLLELCVKCTETFPKVCQHFSPVKNVSLLMQFSIPGSAHVSCLSHINTGLLISE